MTTQTLPTLDELTLKLAAPFPPERVKFRIQSAKTTDREGRVQLVRYITARDVVRRLNEVVGAGGWSYDFDVLARSPKTGAVSEVKGCLTVGGVTKCAIGTAKDDAADLGKQSKSADADGLKRAAVLHAVAAYLYELPPCWHRVNGKAPNAVELRELREAYAKLLKLDTANVGTLQADDFDDDEGDGGAVAEGGATIAGAATTVNEARERVAQRMAETGMTFEPDGVEDEADRDARQAAGPATEQQRVTIAALSRQLGKTDVPKVKTFGEAYTLLDKLQAEARAHNAKTAPAQRASGGPAQTAHKPTDTVSAATIAAFKAEVMTQRGLDWPKVVAGIPQVLASKHAVNAMTYAELAIVRKKLDEKAASATAAG